MRSRASPPAPVAELPENVLAEGPPSTGAGSSRLVVFSSGAVDMAANRSVPPTPRGRAHSLRGALRGNTCGFEGGPSAKGVASAGRGKMPRWCPGAAGWVWDGRVGAHCVVFAPHDVGLY